MSELMKVVASSPSANCVVSPVSTGVDGMERAAAALTGPATHTVDCGASGTGRAAMI
jgi:hypothetical protein